MIALALFSLGPHPSDSIESYDDAEESNLLENKVRKEDEAMAAMPATIEKELGITQKSMLGLIEVLNQAGLKQFK